MLGLVYLIERRKKQKSKSTKKAGDKSRPNYFVAIQITNPDVSDRKSFVSIRYLMHYFCVYLTAFTVNITVARVVRH